MPVLTILDTLSIQTYIFGSNYLKENIGGSELVKRATGQFVKESLPAPHNVASVNDYGILAFDNLRLEDGQLQAEVIYAGGGNTVILFNSLDTARDFAGRLSQKLIADAPGLELAVIHKAFNWQNETLGGDKAGVMFEAFKELEAIKRNQLTTHPLAGLGVTALCQSTGQSATAVDGDGRLISAEVWAKLTVADEANRAFNRLIEDSAYQFEFPREFDELGRSRGESSYIGVVHADGNGMGKRLEKISREHPQAKDNRFYLNALRQFSEQVNQASNGALKKLLDEIRASIREESNGSLTIMEALPLEQDYLPIRPLVFGGDDLTFVCDGRLALTLTEFYLNAFEEETVKAGLEDVHACAGVAVVKSHYPFARAYQLAEDLCKNAKDWVCKAKSQQDFSAIDWHFATSGIMSNIEIIREREYRLDNDTTLLMRPIALNETYEDWRNWPTFKKLVLEFNPPPTYQPAPKDNWAKSRNKVKQLREALRQGEIGFKQFDAAYKPVLLSFPRHASARETAFIGGKSVYYDAIEAMDFFVPLHSDSIWSKK